jgi:signal transduction histidine kinase
MFVLAVLEVPLALNEAHTERQALAATVQRDAAGIAGISQVPGARGLAPVRALQSAARRFQAETGAAVVITGRGGRTLLSTAPVRGAGRDVVSARAPIGPAGRVLGHVRVIYPTASAIGRIHRYRLLLAGVAGLVLAAALVIGLALSGWAARSLRALEDAAWRVRGGDLAARAPAGVGPPEVRAVAAAFNDTTAHLHDLVTAQRAFVADASHQLRSPLTALRLRLENLESAVVPAGRMGFDAALAEVERLTQMVVGLLALARAENTPALPVEHDAVAIVAGRLRVWAPVAVGRSVELQGAGTAGPVRVLATAGHLEQVLDNLLENALAAAPAGSIVTVRCAALARTAELRVSDAGPGLSAEGRARAFDRFWAAGPAHGTGLGLAVVQKLVAADGGTVALQPARGGGLEAVVRLPSPSGPVVADGERHGGQGAAAGRRYELDGRPVAVRDGLGDRQPQTASGHT